MASYHITLKGQGYTDVDAARSKLVKALHGAPFLKLVQIRHKLHIWQLDTIVGREDISIRLHEVNVVESIYTDSPLNEGKLSDTDSNEWVEVSNTSATSTLLSIPAEIRNKTHRFAAVSNQIIVPPNCQPTKEPGWLRTCRQTRQEAVGIYYQENQFVFRIDNFNAGACLKWTEQSKLHLHASTGYVVSHSTNWANLVKWLKAFWGRKFQGLKEKYNAPKLKEKYTAAAMFSLVRKMRGVPGMQWEKIEEVLEVVHFTLKLQNSKWA